MIALIQRVSSAAVEVDGRVLGRIDEGLLALIGIQREDTPEHALRILDKVLGYRVFADSEQRMNRSLREVGGGLLLVSQFTLAADTRKGTRASFTPAAAPDRAQALYDHLVCLARQRHPVVASGRFGAAMKVSLVNDGPVTFWLET